MNSNPPADSPSADYRYKRKLTPVEWIGLGFWATMACCAMAIWSRSRHVPDLRTLTVLAVFVALWLFASAHSQRKAALEIYEDRIRCEIAPGRRRTIRFAAMAQLVESDFDLRIVHLTDKGHVSFSLWKENFGADKWLEIVASITAAASRQSPLLQVHVLKPD